MTAQFMPEVRRIPVAWEEVRTLCLLLAVLLLVFPFVPILQILIPKYCAQLEKQREEEKQRILEERRRKRMTFILVEKAPEEEVKNAKLTGAANRQARDRVVADKPDDSAPHSEGLSPVKSPKLGQPNPQPPGNVSAVSPPKPDPVAKASPQPRPREAEAPDKAKPPKPVVPQPVAKMPETDNPLHKPLPESPKPPRPQPKPEPLPKTRPLEQPDPDALAVADPQPKEQPDEQPKPEKPEEKRPPQDQPIFQKIGSRADPDGRAPEKSPNSAAKLKGNKSFHILMGKYPEYMAIVQKRVQRQLDAAAVVRDRSYHTGRIILSFGIAPDGKLSKLDPVDIPDEMQAEQVICESALRAASPFPPLTAAMQKDIALFRDIGFTVYFY